MCFVVHLFLKIVLVWCHFTWRWQSWTPSCLSEGLSINRSLRLCRSTGLPPLFLDLLYRSFLSTRRCILRVCDLFPHFSLLCICYDIRLFLPNYGNVFLHKLAKENQVSLGEIFTSPSFFFWADDLWHFFGKEYYGIMGYYPLVKLLIHWLVIHSTIQRLSNVKLSSGYGTTG